MQPHELPPTSPATVLPLPPRLQWATLALPGIRSVKRNWRAMVGLQAGGLAVVSAYYMSADVRAFCEMLAERKVQGGLPLAAIVQSFCCGVVPEIAKYAFNVDRVFDAQRWRTIAFNCALYAWLGVVVDTFYTALGRRLGDGVDLQTIATKVAIDQFVFTPLLGIVTIAFAYTFRQYRYNLLRTLGVLGPHWYVTRVVILLLPCWAFWIPMTSLMYALPSSLTFIFGAIASAAASLVLNSVASESAKSSVNAE